MSSILKALKKLEQTGTEKHSETVWPDSFQSMKEKGKRVRSKKKAMFFLCLLTVLCIFSGGFLFYSFRDSTQTLPAVDRENTDKTAPGHSIKTDAGSKRSESRGKRVFTDNSKSDEKKIPEIKRQRITSRDLLPGSFKKKPNIETMQAPGETVDQTGLPKLKNDPRVELQALVWAEDSRDSFVVVNNRIVREGEACDGIVVTKIDKDSVSFRQGREEWRERIRIQ